MSYVIGDYDIGDRVTVTAQFADADGVAADPTTVTAYVKTPAGVVTATSGADLDHPETGTWTHDVDLTEAGTWWVRIEGAGTVTAATETPLQVTPTSFPAAV